MKTYKMKINSENYEARVLEYDGLTARVEVNGVDFFVEINNESNNNLPKLYRSKRELPDSPNLKAKIDSGVTAPIPGVILDIKVKPGDEVKSGQTLVILEAMKMESEIHAPCSGTVKEIMVDKNQSVQEGQKLMELEPKESKQMVDYSRRKSDQQTSKSYTAPAPKPVDGKSKIMKSPLPGTILRMVSKEGDSISEDQTVMILEAMKMESEINSDYTGKIKKIFVNVGDSVQEGQNLFEVE